MRTREGLFGFAACAEVVATAVGVVRDGHAFGRIVACLDALGQIVPFPRRLPDLAFGVVACHVVFGWTCFGDIRIRTRGSFSFLAASAEVVAGLAVGVVRDANALCRVNACLLARRHVRHAYPLGNVNLTLAHVANLVVARWSGGGTGTCVHELRLRAVVWVLGFAASAEVVAPAVAVVRDAEAPWRFAGLLARLDVVGFP
jgi:hypothetical protein